MASSRSHSGSDLDVKEEMALYIVLRRAREKNTRQQSDSIMWESIASTQMTLGSGARHVAAASPKVVRSIRHTSALAAAEPLR